MTEPQVVEVAGEDVLLRRAARADLPALVGLLADDPLGRDREDAADLGSYERAFGDVDADLAHVLLVAEAAGEVVGTLQLTFVPGLSRGGALRSQVEGVRVAAGWQGRGLGGVLMSWVVEESRRRGATLVQLTTDRSRGDAHRFYERLGFVASHVGYKLPLPPR